MIAVFFGRTIDPIATTVYGTTQIRDYLVVFNPVAEHILCNPGCGSSDKGRHGSCNGHDGIDQGVGQGHGIDP